MRKKEMIRRIEEHEARLEYVCSFMDELAGVLVRSGTISDAMQASSNSGSPRILLIGESNISNKALFDQQIVFGEDLKLLMNKLGYKIKETKVSTKRELVEFNPNHGTLGEENDG